MRHLRRGGKRVKIALIAGEASGDRLGGRLMSALKRQRSDIIFSGIGGTRMEEQGLKSFFPMQELSLMGFAEVLPHARRLKRRIRETVEFIEQQQPDVLVTIDSPGFNYRVVKLLREQGKVRPRFIHYVAPTVWAYKPKRAEKTATLFDELLTLLPFEPPLFEVHGLKTEFVGHGVTEDVYEAGKFRAHHGIAPEKMLLCVMPGSRRGELEKLLPVFAEAVRLFASRLGAPLSLVIPTTLHSARLLESMSQDWPVKPIIVTEESEKRAAMAAADLALAKSGTITLEAAMAGLPMIAAYKVHPLSAWLLRRMISTRFVSLINILEDREVIPELLQERCAGQEVGEALAALWRDDAKREEQRRAYAEALAKLRAPRADKTPSEVAAEIILRPLPVSGDL